jgi:threonine synthase
VGNVVIVGGTQGLGRELAQSYADEGRQVVVTVTGHGLKDPAAADRHAPGPSRVDPDPDEIARAAG